MLHRYLIVFIISNDEKMLCLFYLFFLQVWLLARLMLPPSPLFYLHQVTKYLCIYEFFLCGTLDLVFHIVISKNKRKRSIQFFYKINTYMIIFILYEYPKGSVISYLSLIFSVTWENVIITSSGEFHKVWMLLFHFRRSDTSTTCQ